ncbi:MAG: transcription termination factor Rho, partial [Bacillota bacterium]|nr:transcription termination factor Rho [Bacillota bacterium]
DAQGDLSIVNREEESVRDSKNSSENRGSEITGSEITSSEKEKTRKTESKPSVKGQKKKPSAVRETPDSEKNDTRKTAKKETDRPRTNAVEGQTSNHQHSSVPSAVVSQNSMRKTKKQEVGKADNAAAREGGVETKAEDAPAVEQKTQTRDFEKKGGESRKKRRKPSTTYVNSLVGMVKYEETSASGEREAADSSSRIEETESPVEDTLSAVDNEFDAVMEQEPSKEPSGIRVEGIFELSDQSGATYGFLRQNGISSEDDIYVSPMFVKKFNLKSGELVRGYAKLEQTDRHRPITYVSDVNGVPPYTTRSKHKFDDMTPQVPNQRFHLSHNGNDIAMRIIDLIAPVGKGQRGLIVAPPKSGKTILLQKIAKSIKRNYPEVELMILLIDERPEEVTDMKDEVDAAVYYSTFDELPINHIRIAELVLNRARGLVEMGRDVVILLDSITRLARAYNIAMPASGRTLSGGLDTNALHKPKRFLGSARNMIEGGSLTIMATALIETGSKMDDVIFEEFKGTGNMELILDRKLSEKRIFPSIDIKKSGTRREELLLNREEYEAVMKLRRALDQNSGNEPIELLSEELMRTKDNAELIAWINQVFVENKFRK